MTRTAIVTGSARGIGKAIALRLAADGYDVCVNDIPANKAGADEVVKEIEGMGRKSLAVMADVSKKSEVESLVQQSVDALGPLHTMVANAGIAQVKGLLEMTEEDFERMFQVNVFGFHNCYSVAAKQMIKQGPLESKEEIGARKESGVYKIIGAASIVAFKPCMSYYLPCLVDLLTSPKLPYSVITLLANGQYAVSTKLMPWSSRSTRSPAIVTRQALSEQPCGISSMRNLVPSPVQRKETQSQSTLAN